MPRGIWTEKMLFFNVCAKFGRNCDFLLQNKSPETKQRLECGRSYPCWPLCQLPGGLGQGGSASSPPRGSPASPDVSPAFGLLTMARLEIPGESQPPQRAASRTFHGCGHRSWAGSFPSTRSHHPEWKWGPSPLRGHPPLCPTQNGLGKTTTMSHPPRWGLELGNQQAEGTWGQEVWAQVGGVDSASLRLCPFPGRLWPPVSGLGPEGCPPHLHTHLTQTRDGDTSEDQHVHSHR